MTLKRQIYYLYVKIRKKLIPKSYYKIIDAKEVKARKLALKLIESQDSILKICPITNKRYVINIRYRISIIIEAQYIDFFSETLHRIEFSPKNYFLITNGFDKATAKDREALEARIKNKVNSSFTDMYHQVFRPL